MIRTSICHKHRKFRNNKRKLYLFYCDCGRLSFSLSSSVIVVISTQLNTNMIKLTLPYTLYDTYIVISILLISFDAQASHFMTLDSSRERKHEKKSVINQSDAKALKESWMEIRFFLPEMTNPAKDSNIQTETFIPTQDSHFTNSVYIYCFFCSVIETVRRHACQYQL